jgi:hypothetical protein
VRGEWFVRWVRGRGMRDFRKIGAGLEPAIPPADVEKIAPVLEALEKSLAPLRTSIPTGADVWTGPEDFE